MDEVIVPSRTYFATASCVVARGGKPVPADVDLISQNITVNSIKASLSAKTKGVIVVHLGGWPCEMQKIKQFCDSNGLFLIEDCAQAHGASIEGKLVGTFGDCAAFSFCQDKILSTGGEGGMLLVDDEVKWKKAWSFKDHGKSYEEVQKIPQVKGFKWLHKSFGTNWRMTEMQAAIGRIQLKKLCEWVGERQKNAGLLHNGLKGANGIRLCKPDLHIKHAFYRFYAFLDTSCLVDGWDQARVLEQINSRGVPCFVGSCGEIYKEEAFKKFPDIYDIPFKNSRELFQTSLAFLVHPGLPTEALELTIETVKNVIDRATH